MRVVKNFRFVLAHKKEQMTHLHKVHKIAMKLKTLMKSFYSSFF